MRNYGVIAVCIMFLLTACQQETEQLPTLFPSATPLPPVTDTATSTLTLTATPLTRPTLPPTWTPTDVPSDTPLPPTNTPLATVIVPTLSPACDIFRPDTARNPRDFALGTAPTVHWTAVEGAGSYYIRLIDEFAAQLHEDYVLETSYTFPAELFKAGTRYGWEVYPLDARGIQMCFAVGDELVPR